MSDDFFWAKGAIGTISAPPDIVTSLSGAWHGGLSREETSALGKHSVYWVWFDEPQFDADGDGPYGGAQIWEGALSLITEKTQLKLVFGESIRDFDSLDIIIRTCAPMRCSRVGKRSDEVLKVFTSIQVWDSASE